MKKHCVFVLLALGFASVALATHDPQRVRDTCYEAYTTAFPAGQVATSENIENWDKLFVDGAYFACPHGVPEYTIPEVHSGNVKDLFNKNVDLNKIMIGNSIGSAIQVAGDSCSFVTLKMFHNKQDPTCFGLYHAVQVIRVNDDGKITEWMEHFDYEKMMEQVKRCFGESTTERILETFDS